MTNIFKIKVGDRVVNKKLNKKGTVVDDLENGLVEIKDGDDAHFYWYKINLEKEVSKFSREFDRIWKVVEPECTECICTGRELFNFGCICGYMENKKGSAGESKEEN